MTVITGDATATRVASPAPPAPSAPGGLRKESAWRRRDRRWGYVFIGPQVIGMAVFVLLPFVASLVLAFASWDGLTELTWVGFENFTAQLQDELLLRSIVNTLLHRADHRADRARPRRRHRGRPREAQDAHALPDPVLRAGRHVDGRRRDDLAADVPRRRRAAARRSRTIFGIAPPDWLGDPKLALHRRVHRVDLVVARASTSSSSWRACRTSRPRSSRPRASTAPAPWRLFTQHPAAAALADHLLLVDRGVHLVAADVRHRVRAHRRTPGPTTPPARSSTTSTISASAGSSSVRRARQP